MEVKDHQPKQAAKPSILSYYNTSSRLAAASSKSSMAAPQQSFSETQKQAVTKTQVVSDPRLKKIEKSLGITKKVEKVSGTTQLKSNQKI